MFEKGATKKLMIFAPPQTGTSTLSSRMAPSYFLGKNPNRKIALTSYSADHSQSFNRDVQRIIDSEIYHSIFPETTLNSSNVSTSSKKGYKRTSNIFEVVGYEGFLKTVGVGGSLTGTTVDIGIIDDPIKGREDAESSTYKKRIWNWYTDVFESRLHNHSQQLLLLTRWNEDDLAGKILERDGDVRDGGEWMVIRLPALRDDMNDPKDPREIGEALWPEKHSKERMEKIRENSPRTFTSMYQQRPAPLEGSIINRNWFQWYDPNKINLNEYPINFYIDAAYTDKENNDPTAILAWIYANQNWYFVDMEVVRLEFPDLIKLIKTYTYEMDYSSGSRIIIEPKASGLSIVQELKKNTRLNVIADSSPKDSKEVRVHSITPQLEAGRVYLPLKSKWTDSFILECVSFPNAKHDDQVDVMVGAIKYVLRKTSKRTGKRKIKTF